MTLLGLLDLVLQDLGFDPEIRQLFAQPLGVDAERLSFLLPNLDLFLHHDAPFNRLVVLGLHILEGGGGIAGLSFKVIICYLDIA